MIPRNVFFFSSFFFMVLGSVVLLYFLTFFFPSFEVFANIALVLLLGSLVIDFLLLVFYPNGIIAIRKIPNVSSNNQKIAIEVITKSHFFFPSSVELLEELPHQLNDRNFKLNTKLKAKEHKSILYQIQPRERGEYHFGSLNFFVKTPLRLLIRKYKITEKQVLKILPSYHVLHKYEIINLKNQEFIGNKNIRKLGNSLEFEQIKEYTIGDDMRTINWKATAKKSTLMVNQFTDEKSQQIYTAIDTGRWMKMPFKEMSLVDYAINASLVVLKASLKHKDKAGMFSFNKEMQQFVIADKKSQQMQCILESLYNIKPEFLDTDFSKLYAQLRYKIRNRSLILMFTNFENLDSLYRQLSYLRSINKHHVLVTIFFKNVEIEEQLYHKFPSDYRSTIEKTLYEKFVFDKRIIVKELNRHGIHTILTAPESLTIDVLNKYLEIKAKNLL